MSTTALYRAESMVRNILASQYDCPTTTIYGSTITVPLERCWADLTSLAQYVQSLDPTITVRSRRGSASAHYEPATHTIAVPVRRGATDRTPWAMRQLVVLHELAHARTRYDQDAHGPAFAQAFLDLVLQEMGPEAHFLLQAMFHENGVRTH
jgi:putative metallohydrolase (TIGR04338 family)